MIYKRCVRVCEYPHIDNYMTEIQACLNNRGSQSNSNKIQSPDLYSRQKTINSGDKPVNNPLSLSWCRFEQRSNLLNSATTDVNYD